MTIYSEDLPNGFVVYVENHGGQTVQFGSEITQAGTLKFSREVNPKMVAQNENGDEVISLLDSIPPNNGCFVQIGIVVVADSGYSTRRKFHASHHSTPADVSTAFGRACEFHQPFYLQEVLYEE